MSHLNPRSFMRFVLVGGSATAIHYAIMFVLLKLQLCDKTVASSTGFVISAIFNYLANAHFTFQGDHNHAESVPRFVAMMAAGAVINASVLNGLVWIGLPVWLAQILATGVVLVWNYIINAVWTFKARQA